jgi:thiamine-monophosphate kinase
MQGVGGEFELIDALRARIAAAGAADSGAVVVASGDDAAITLADGATATSVDALVEGVHFRMPPFTARQVGHKALAAALSDLAAMGAHAGEAYVQLGVPEERDDAELLALGDGLAKLASRHGVAVVGGDVTRAPVLLVAVTVVGRAASVDDLVRRSGAGAGDLVVVTGALGGAAAGLQLLERPGLAEALGDDVAEALRLRQLEPNPRLAAGLALAATGATAMIDVSDGFGADAGHLAAAGGVALNIDLDAVPVQTGVPELAATAGIDPLDLAIAGGEDYELLATVASADLERATAAVRAVGAELTTVGEVVDGEGVALRGSAGERPAAGFDQLRPRQAPDAPA